MPRASDRNKRSYNVRMEGGGRYTNQFFTDLGAAVLHYSRLVCQARANQLIVLEATFSDKDQLPLDFPPTEIARFLYSDGENT